MREGDGRVLRGQWGAAVSTQVCVCGAVSRCFVWLVLSFVAARVSHVIPVAPVVLHGFR